MTSLSLGQYQKLFMENLLTEHLSYSKSEDLLSHFQQNLKDSDASEEAMARFTIYRNNVILSLSIAVADTFPVVKRLVGDEHFKKATIVFVRHHPPQHSSLMFYGKEFIKFIKTWPAFSALPYLGDIAQLEWFYIRAFHAEDVEVLENDSLQQIAPENLAEVSFTAHPSVHLMQSEWPIDTIWKENLKEQVGIIDLDKLAGCNLLIYRQQLQVSVIALTADCFNFLSKLTEPKTIIDAWNYTVERQQLENRAKINEKDLTGMLSYLLSLSLFATLQS